MPPRSLTTAPRNPSYLALINPTIMQTTRCVFSKTAVFYKLSANAEGKAQPLSNPEQKPKGVSGSQGSARSEPVKLRLRHST